MNKENRLAADFQLTQTINEIAPAVPGQYQLELLQSNMTLHNLLNKPSLDSARLLPSESNMNSYIHSVSVQYNNYCISDITNSNVSSLLVKNNNTQLNMNRKESKISTDVQKPRNLIPRSYNQFMFIMLSSQEKWNFVFEKLIGIFDKLEAQEVENSKAKEMQTSTQ
jgi:hypothetical protein